jgi:hypothetical protein
MGAGASSPFPAPSSSSGVDKEFLGRIRSNSFVMPCAECERGAGCEHSQLQGRDLINQLVLVEGSPVQVFGDGGNEAGAAESDGERDYGDDGDDYESEFGSSMSLRSEGSSTGMVSNRDVKTVSLKDMGLPGARLVFRNDYVDKRRASNAAMQSWLMD